MFPFHSFYSEIKLDEAAVLHYTYPKFSDLTSRRDRCGCKPTKEDVKRCFMLEFDRAVSSDSFTMLVFYPFTPHGWQKKKKKSSFELQECQLFVLLLLKLFSLLALHILPVILFLIYISCV